MVRPKAECALGALYFGIAVPCHAQAWVTVPTWGHLCAALHRLVLPCIPSYCFVFVLYFSVLRCLGFVLPCIVLYLFCIALYFLVFVLYALYCLVLPRIALGTLRPVSWQVVPLVRFVFLGLLP